MKNIMKKNQFVILVIALMLVTAGYLNYTGNNTYENEYIGTSTIPYENKIEENVILEESLEEKSNSIAEETVESSVKPKETDSYFVTSKLQRDTMYSQMIESYQKILESPSVTAEQKSIATQEISNINNTKNAIMICENLLQTKGFSESVIFINDISISVIIKSEELTKEEIAQIQNIIAREMNAEIENIHISNKN